MPIAIEFVWCGRLHPGAVYPPAAPTRSAVAPSDPPGAHTFDQIRSLCQKSAREDRQEGLGGDFPSQKPGPRPGYLVLTNTAAALLNTICKQSSSACSFSLILDLPFDITKESVFVLVIDLPATIGQPWPDS